jgi:hypothetical protein
LRRLVKPQLGTAALRNALRNGQPQATAAGHATSPLTANKALQDALALGRCNAWTRIFHHQCTSVLVLQPAHINRPGGTYLIALSSRLRSSTASASRLRPR